MNLLDNPQLLERLGAAHALGTLRGGARRRFEALARQEPRIRAEALVWRSRLAGLVELQPAVEPPQDVWSRIAAHIAHDIQPPLGAQEVTPAVVGPADAVQPTRVVQPRPRSPLPWWQQLSWWGPAGIGAGLAAVVFIVLGIERGNTIEGQFAQLRGLLQAQTQRADTAQAQLAQVQRVDYVAVLADDRSTASMLVTFDPVTRRLTLKRIGDFRETADKSLQLWVIAPGEAPRSLGVLGTDATIQLTVQERDVSASPTLAISLEPKGGVPGAGGPTGPVLFKGAVLKTSS